MNRRGNWWRRLRCFLGLHHWAYTRPPDLAADIFPMDPTWEPSRRACLSCDTKQEWLPGYGGSEIGCWTRMRSTHQTGVSE